MSDAKVVVHGTCVAIGGRGVLLTGRSGSGKSDLALRLIDRGALLVSDDYTCLRRAGPTLIASAPERIAGRLEIRGIGLVETGAAEPVALCLVAELDAPPERLPEKRFVALAGIELPVLALAALEPSAPIKLERALQLFGLILE